jgi:hypothetical protein
MYPDGERERLLLPAMHYMYALILRDRATDGQKTEQNFIFSLLKWEERKIKQLKNT